MGQKIHPTGYRIGISKPWKSKWFPEKGKYGDNVIEDHKIRKLLREKFDTAGLKTIEIERSVNDIKINLKVSKPGVVIGKGGVIVEAAKEDLKKLTNAKISISVEEIKVPELEAELVAGYLARQLKRRMPYRRIATMAANAAIDKGAKGIKIKLSGLLGGGNSIARSEVISKGSVPTQTLRADIDYAQLHCYLIYGTVGIKVWIYKGELDL